MFETESVPELIFFLIKFILKKKSAYDSKKLLSMQSPKFAADFFFETLSDQRRLNIHVKHLSP